MTTDKDLREQVIIPALDVWAQNFDVDGIVADVVAVAPLDTWRVNPSTATLESEMIEAETFWAIVENHSL